MRTERSHRALTLAIMAVACLAMAALSLDWLVPGDTVWSAEGMPPISDESDFVSSGGLLPASASHDTVVPPVPFSAVNRIPGPEAPTVAEPTVTQREPARTADPQDPPAPMRAPAE